MSATTENLSLPVYEYVRGVFKGSGETLGNITAQARLFELDMNVWIDWSNLKEGL